ncbi:FMN-dependent oxidoreductase, nitrilotriacetate monooxygenase family [Ewingella americana]|uniref:FMN-dependent oxidoreductase, nitrilotriacetate monooxygenase family n=1 Tax=Ewingella americana TaxID=41202 RepID=A0A377NF26_9GAMM|nr:FMN-dependent oxidoreductase, nitrilotriacetate monooxygenase family [Ewingella americana]
MAASRCAGQEIFTLKYFADLARKAEAATLDNIFIADHVAVWDTVPSGMATTPTRVWSP